MSKIVGRKAITIKWILRTEDTFTLSALSLRGKGPLMVIHETPMVVWIVSLHSYLLLCSSLLLLYLMLLPNIMLLYFLLLFLLLSSNLFSFLLLGPSTSFVLLELDSYLRPKQALMRGDLYLENILSKALLLFSSFWYWDNSLFSLSMSCLNETTLACNLSHKAYFSCKLLLNISFNLLTSPSW